MSKTLRIIGKIWFVLLGVVVAIGGIAIILTDGIWQFWAIFSPFNIWNWGLIFVLALPGIGLLKLADRIGKKP